MSGAADSLPEVCDAKTHNKKKGRTTMPFAIPRSFSRATLLYIRDATSRALPYVLLALALLGYALIAVSRGWL